MAEKGQKPGGQHGSRDACQTELAVEIGLLLFAVLIVKFSYRFGMEGQNVDILMRKDGLFCNTVSFFLAGDCILGPDRKCLLGPNGKCLLQELPGGFPGEEGGWSLPSCPGCGDGRGFLGCAENWSEMH